MEKQKTDTQGLAYEKNQYQIRLVGEGILVGIGGGLVTLAYRISLQYADQWRAAIIRFANGHGLRMLGWFLVLGLLAVIVGKMIKIDPLISGSGIPQVEGEMVGKIRQNWKTILVAKFIGGFCCLFGGMSLGREGPSIQLGAMAGKGISRSMGREKTEEKFLLTCGASAGLAAAFHAPLAGVMFALEEVHKGFSMIAVLSVMTSAITSDYICTYLLGVEPVFHFNLTTQIAPEHYWLLIILGVILGFAGVFYNWFTLKVQSLYAKAKKLNTTLKLLIPFMLCGILAFTAPKLLGSGHSVLEEMCSSHMALSAILLLLLGKFVFSAICFGSGAPGGIFFPLLVLGGFIGGAFSNVASTYLHVDPMYFNNFVTLAMAGYFTAIVRAPLTGIILIFEMTGTLDQFLSLSIVSIIAYIVASVMNSEPIYESLLNNLLAKQGKLDQESANDEPGNKVLSYFRVLQGSMIANRKIKDIKWPSKCLLVCIDRGEEELIPNGKTKILPGDLLTIVSNEEDVGHIHDRMDDLNEASIESLWRRKHPKKNGQK